MKEKLIKIGAKVVQQIAYAPLEAALAASPQFGLNQTDVFVIDNEGARIAAMQRGGIP